MGRNPPPPPNKTNNKIGKIANSEETDELSHNVSFYQGMYYLLRSSDQKCFGNCQYMQWTTLTLLYVASWEMPLVSKGLKCILRDFKNAPFYILCLFHMICFRKFSLSFLYPFAKWTMIFHDFDLLMLFILT